jgi:dTDP-4-amino-4,6-dideoxygalactose transaminase
VKIKADIAKTYCEGLQDCSLSLFDYGDSNFYKFPVVLHGMDREKFSKLMLGAGIRMSANCVDVPTYRQKAFGTDFAGISLRGCEQFCSSHVCLPMHEWLFKSDVEKVIEETHRILGYL